MTNSEYIETMISQNDLIYIDTATLMEIEGMENFIQSYEDIFIRYSKKMIVSKAVCYELARHLGSSNQVKVELALQVIGILVRYNDLFEVRNSGMTETELAKAFADSHLLSELTVNKTEYGQLLITNDKKLSRDAYGINNQESCKGHRVMVCYINRVGELHMCECVKGMALKRSNADDVFAEMIEIEKTMPSYVSDSKQKAELQNTKEEASLVQNEEGWLSWIGAGIFAGATFAFGTYIGMKNPRLLENFSL